LLQLLPHVSRSTINKVHQIFADWVFMDGLPFIGWEEEEEEQEQQQEQEREQGMGPEPEVEELT
jgi:hypothetical protein